MAGGATAPAITNNYTFTVNGGASGTASITIQFSVEIKFGFFLGYSGQANVIRQGDNGTNPINFGHNLNTTTRAIMTAASPGDIGYTNAGICKLFFAPGSGTTPSYNQTIYFSTRTQASYPATGTNLYRTTPYGIEQLTITPLTGTYAAGSVKTAFLRSQAAAINPGWFY